MTRGGNNMKGTNDTQEENLSIVKDMTERFPLMNRHTMASIREGLRAIHRRWGYGDPEADRLFAHLSAPSKILETLHRSAQRVLAEDAGAASQLRATVRDLIQQFPQYEGSVKLMQQHAKLSPVPIPVDPCGGLTGPGELLTIYIAVGAAFPRTEPELIKGLDVIAGLSLQHGHLEVIHDAMMERGLDGLEEEMQWGKTTGHNIFGPAQGGLDPGLVGYTPEPDGPPGEPWGPRRWPDGPPKPTDCEIVREACEALLADALSGGVGDPPKPPERIVWADNINQIEMLGQCAGDRIIIHGSNFGNPKPQGIEVVLVVNDECQPIPADSWTDTRIEVTLPDGINSGMVGFVDMGYINAYNAWRAQWNQYWQDLATANLCLEQGDLRDIADRMRLPRMEIPCAPLTAVNVISAGTPIIRYFTANFESVVVVEPDEPIILRWNVRNADEVILERISPQGPMFNNNARVVNLSWTPKLRQLAKVEPCP
jgi:hypothetical protein